jgi:hypothetical protein
VVNTVAKFRTAINSDVAAIRQNISHFQEEVGYMKKTNFVSAGK